MKPTSQNTTAVPRWLAIVLGLVAVAGGLMLPLVLPRPGGHAPPVQSTPSAEEPATEKAPKISQIDIGGSMTRLYAAAFVVLVVGVGGIWLYRRRLAAYSPAPIGGDLEVLGAARIDLRSQVVLVRARGQKLLAGIDGTGLRLLVPISTTSAAATSANPEESARAA